MFTNLIFLILAFLIAGVKNPNPGVVSFILSLFSYFSILVLILIQNKILIKKRFWDRDRVLFIVNIELLIYFCLLFIVWGIPKFPYFENLSSIFSAMLLYFFGLYVFHLSSFQANWSSRGKVAEKQIRFLVPFTLPIIFYAALMDFFSFYRFSISHLHFSVLLLGGLLFALILAVLIPPLLILFWQSPQLNDELILEHFNELCRKAKFRHGGFKLWTVLNNIPNAAIIGIIPSLRYIMFTPTLLNTQSKDTLEAILAHEMGHSVHRHLLLFPFILVGMALLEELLFSFLNSGLSQSFELLTWLYPSIAWSYFETFIYLALPALLIVLYIRFVFGYFSRLFERQADLYGFKIGIPISTMINALNKVAEESGNIHDVPSWHHYSINQRVGFLEDVEKNPSLIDRHHRRVKRALICYSLFMGSVLFFLLSPSFPNTEPFKFLNGIGVAIEKKITDGITFRLRDTATKKYIIAHGMEKYELAIKKSVSDAFLIQGVFQYPDRLDKIVLQNLLYSGLVIPAAALELEINRTKENK